MGCGGSLAHLLVPGPDALGILGTIGLCIVGSFVGGFLGYLFFATDATKDRSSRLGILGSVIGGVITLLLYPAVTRRDARV